MTKYHLNKPTKNRENALSNRGVPLFLGKRSPQFIFDPLKQYYLQHQKVKQTSK
ncbi:hypothetical protein [Metabacillus iocasae]|uniref:Uncharacterized protein n=1 Tax=Priestia iocasae TaxID=2291674 RepID=A0ABS2QYG1_9BACI|nr:hypothetical protein [Metabacillus iocasae]MBM7704017.1 hypothetical protein [Metabacillus iocasae]